MKITCLLLLVAIVQVSAATYAQSTKLTLDMENAKLSELFEEIENSSEFRFFYDSNAIDLSREVTIHTEKSNINDILAEAFAGTEYSYVLIDRHIIVQNKGKESTVLADAGLPQNAVQGVVKTAGGDPIPGVTVLVKGTTNGTVTNEDGEYSLSGVMNGDILLFSFIGMEAQEIEVGNNRTIEVVMRESTIGIEEVVAIGYGTQKKESLTGAIASVGAEDLERVHASTVSSTLAGKLAGVSFRMPDGRPGASATIQIRNMGNPLYVIDGIQKDAGQFNNLSPNDIESISVLKDASAAIYGVRAANGVVVVTTKRGKKSTKNTINVNAYMGWQNWSRFPETVNAYDWMLGKAYAEMNLDGSTNITQAELDKWKAGTEYGYQSFDWYDFIIQPNAPQNSINVSTSGGSDKINYYFSLTRLDQTSVLGREFTFDRTNFQSNIDAQITDRLKVGASINGRIETRDNPGVPGGDDYWAPRFALFRNRPTERPYANDNPEYINNIGHMAENWGLLTKEKSGYWTEDWRVLQLNFNGQYDFLSKDYPLKELIRITLPTV
ncbi:MAG: SusC/RagA family TonB-linked outer membrane protein [Draconibacterium sp.]